MRTRPAARPKRPSGSTTNFSQQRSNKSLLAGVGRAGLQHENAPTQRPRPRAPCPLTRRRKSARQSGPTRPQQCPKGTPCRMSTACHTPGAVAQQQFRHRGSIKVFEKKFITQPIVHQHNIFNTSPQTEHKPGPVLAWRRRSAASWPGAWSIASAMRLGLARWPASAC